MKPKTLFGPYGTELLRISQEKNTPAIHRPLSLLWHHPTRESIQRISQDYSKSGATISCTPTYGLRQLLNPSAFAADLQGITHQGDRTFREALGQSILLTRSALSIFRRPHFHVVNLGSVHDAFAVDPILKTPLRTPSWQESKDFHSLQLGITAESRPDGVLFEAINSADEARGIALAATDHEFPTIISFLLDQSGALPTGETVAEAIRSVSTAVRHEVFFGINCCPPEVLKNGVRSAHASAKSFGGVRSRLLAAYPNAVSKPLDELGTSPTVQGVLHPHHQAAALRNLAAQYHIRIIGGCCGFGPEDIRQIARSA